VCTRSLLGHAGVPNFGELTSTDLAKITPVGIWDLVHIAPPPVDESHDKVHCQRNHVIACVGAVVDVRTNLAVAANPVR
jgi:hypothetical protein